MNMNTPKSLFFTKPSSQCGHLEWKFPTKEKYIIPFVLVIASLILMARPMEFKAMSISYFVIGAILSALLVTCMISYNSKEGITNYISETLNASSISFGSYWCWFVAFFSFLLFFINPLIQPKK